MRPELWLQACGATSSGRPVENPRPLGHLTPGGYPQVQQTDIFALQANTLVRSYVSSTTRAPAPRGLLTDAADRHFCLQEYMLVRSYTGAAERRSALQQGELIGQALMACNSHLSKSTWCSLQVSLPSSRISSSDEWKTSEKIAHMHDHRLACKSRRDALAAKPLRRCFAVVVCTQDGSEVQSDPSMAQQTDYDTDKEATVC